MNPAQLQKMMKQAQKLQNEMQNAQTELGAKEYTITTGGDAITLVMTGNKKVVSINIKDEVIDPEDKDMLEDMIKSAMNTLIDQIDNDAQTTMSQYTQGLPF